MLFDQIVFIQPFLSLPFSFYASFGVKSGKVLYKKMVVLLMVWILFLGSFGALKQPTILGASDMS